MSFDEYQQLAQRTSNTVGFEDKLNNGILGLCGEAGECADLVKKFKYQGHKTNYMKLIEEMGDVLWYIAELATALSVSMETVAFINIDKLKKRYPLGFAMERSVNREEE